MAIPESIKKKANQVRNEVYGKDVREALASGIEEAGDIADQANTKSDNAVEQVDNIQAQVDQLVVEGDSSVEAAQARVDKRGNTHTTLKERVDAQEYFVNVKSFGAMGDGVTDDTPSFLSAIQEAKGGKGILYAPKGVYAVSLDEELNDLVIDADGAKFVSASDDFIFRLTGNNITLRNIEIEETQELTSGCIALIGDNNIISGVKIYNKNKTTRESITYAQRHIDIQGNNNKVINCEVINGRVGIYFSGIGTRILNCRIEGNIIGVRVAPDSDDFEIAHNRIVGGEILRGALGADGIHVTSTETATSGNIHHNYIEGADEHGIYCHGSGVQISHNIVTKCWHSGIKVATGQYMDVNDNLCFENTKNPESTSADIYVQSPVRNVTVLNNTCYGSMNGIRSVLREDEDDLNNIIIKNNVCRDHTGRSLHIFGKDGTIVEGNVGDVLFLSADTGRRKITVKNNNVAEINLNRMDGSVVEGNTISEKINITTNNSRLIFKNNDITTSEEFDLRNVEIFDGNKVVFRGIGRFYPSAGVVSLLSFCNNDIEALDLVDSFVLAFRSGGNLSLTRINNNHFAVSSTSRAALITSFSRGQFLGNTTNSTDEQAFNFNEVTNSVIKGNVAAGGIWLSNNATGNIVTNNIAEIRANEVENTVANNRE